MTLTKGFEDDHDLVFVEPQDLPVTRDARMDSETPSKEHENDQSSIPQTSAKTNTTIDAEGQEGDPSHAAERQYPEEGSANQTNESTSATSKTVGTSMPEQQKPEVDPYLAQAIQNTLKINQEQKEEDNLQRKEENPGLWKLAGRTIKKNPLGKKILNGIRDTMDTTKKQSTEDSSTIPPSNEATALEVENNREDDAPADTGNSNEPFELAATSNSEKHENTSRETKSATNEFVSSERSTNKANESASAISETEGTSAPVQKPEATQNTSNSNEEQNSSNAKDHSPSKEENPGLWKLAGRTIKKNPLGKKVLNGIRDTMDSTKRQSTETSLIEPVSEVTASSEIEDNREDVIPVDAVNINEPVESADMSNTQQDDTILNVAKSSTLELGSPQPDENPGLWKMAGRTIKKNPVGKKVLNGIRDGVESSKKESSVDPNDPSPTNASGPVDDDDTPVCLA